MSMDHSHITVRKHSFLSSAAFGLSAIVITVVVSLTVLVLYGVHLASEKSDQVISLAQGAIHGLPQFRQALPPALSDMLDDRRDPDYCRELGIDARVVTRPGSHGRAQTAVEITNNGTEVVSLLSLRVVLLDENGGLLTESQEWAATPFAADHDWRGPIMPGSRRRFLCSGGHLYDVGPLDEIKAEIEITELRVWNGPETQQGLPGEPAVSVSASALPSEAR
ncbi:MAG: hypothetical protein RBS72_18485 [Sedimentisphaerales bacterium]|jgi:hypothetical protein|nr:hypothetical protein [Sedimentisphaerales bacterium]NLZ06426.1 hypothetical protein [Phycisphaerae bacterium]HNY78401.1 hypothetical protein [Sedimentisphaerales bacterium]HOC63602.1 hypothetical protein [Sedimentisphaerales bacterium]HOH64460.1 hypothetical protein [Sedimentisphaerales bacterium]